MTLKINRRSTLGLLAGGTGLLAAPGLIRPAMAQTAQVNVTTYDGFLPQEFVDRFQRDTGIRVNIRLTDDQGKQYNLLAAEAGTPTTDIVTVTGHRLTQFIGSDLLAPLDTARLSHWANLAPAYEGAPQLEQSGQIWGMPLLAGYEALLRNTDYTRPADSWAALFEDDYRGMTTYILSDFITLVMKMQGNDGDFVIYDGKPEEAQAAVNEAQRLLIEKKPWVRKYYDSAAELQQMFLNEDAYIAQIWSGAGARLIMEGAPVEMSIPTEGTYGFLYSFNIANNAPNADAAYQLLDAILADPSVGAAMTRASGFASAIDGVGDLLDERERAALSLPDEQMERITYFSPINRDMKNSMIDAAVSAIKAA